MAEANDPATTNNENRGSGTSASGMIFILTLYKIQATHNFTRKFLQFEYFYRQISGTFRISRSGEESMEKITWNDFQKVELRVGTIVEVEEFPKARHPAYKLRVDFGPEVGTRTSSAQITTLYRQEELLGRQVIGVVNFPPKRIGPFMSECLITGFARDDGAIVLAVPDCQVQNGAKLC
jgi:tRNA-binding protein